MTRIALLGPASDDGALLREAIELCALGSPAFDKIVYLGIDGALDHALDAAVQKWTGTQNADEWFFAQGAATACTGDATAIRALLETEAKLTKLSTSTFRVPGPPARAIEMLDDRLAILIYDKAHLDEDDIASAQILVYGRSKKCDLRKFGPRCFFTPGPLKERTYGVLALDAQGAKVSALSFDGELLATETISTRLPKVTVQK